MEAELFQFIESKRLKNVSIMLSDDRKEGIVWADNGPFEPSRVVLGPGFSAQVTSSLFLEEVMASHQNKSLFRQENILLASREIQLPDPGGSDPRKEKIQDLLYLQEQSEDKLYRQLLTAQLMEETIRYHMGKVEATTIDQHRELQPVIYDQLAGDDPIAFIAGSFASKQRTFVHEVRENFRFTLKRSGGLRSARPVASLLIEEQLFALAPKTEERSNSDVASFAFLRQELNVFKSWDCLNLVYGYCAQLSAGFHHKNEQVAVVFYHVKMLLDRYTSFDMAKYMVILLKGASFLESQKMHNINLEWKINRKLLEMIENQPVDLASLKDGLTAFLDQFEPTLLENRSSMALQDLNIIYPRYAFLLIHRLFMCFKINAKEQSRIFTSLFFQDFLQNQPSS